jgi:hypothetical protein
VQVIAIPKTHRRARRLVGGEGTDFVRCRICGKHLRVISGRHLSTHGSDRETYMDEYGLSPDKLCAKEFRRLHSSRRDYYPHGNRHWIAAIKKIHKQHGQVFAGYLQDNLPHLYSLHRWKSKHIAEQCSYIRSLAILSHKYLEKIYGDFLGPVQVNTL